MTERIVNDNYPTPGWVTHLLLDRAPSLFLSVLDPCAGAGSILGYAHSLGRTGIELDPVHKGSPLLDGARMLWGDALAMDWTVLDYESVVMNPPYSLAGAFIEKALTSSPDKPVAALLRLSFLEPVQSRRWLLRLAPWVGVLPKRPKFRADKTGCDCVTSAWFVWSMRGMSGWELL